jgi:hypothetical protein
MKVRALTTFVDESGKHEPGDVCEMADVVADLRIKAGLVAPLVAPEVREAVAPEPETAVTRKKGKR